MICQSHPISTHIPFFLTLLSILFLTLVDGREFVCQPANYTAMPYCKAYVNYPIASDLDISLLDNNALIQHQRSCEYWGYQPYACSQYFPRCVDGTNGVASETKICRDYCEGAVTNADCRLAFGDDETFYQRTCSSNLYTSSLPCIGAEELALPDSSRDQIYWKIGLGVGLGVFALILIFGVYRKYKHETVTPEELARYDAKQSEKAAKAKEKESKSAKEQTSSNKSPPKKARSHNPPQHLQPDEDIQLELDDIELGEAHSNDSNLPKSGNSNLSSVASASASATPAPAPGPSHGKKSKKHSASSRTNRPLLDESDSNPLHSSTFPRQTDPNPPVPVSMLYSNSALESWKSGQPTRVALPEE